MSKSYGCALCGRSFKGPRTFALHLIDAHADVFAWTDAGFDLYAKLRCPCGGCYYLPTGNGPQGVWTIADHLRSAEVMADHLLAVLLLQKPGGPPP